MIAQLDTMELLLSLPRRLDVQNAQLVHGVILVAALLQLLELQELNVLRDQSLKALVQEDNTVILQLISRKLVAL